MDLNHIKTIVRDFAGEPLPPWEQHYLDIHAARYLDTIDVLGPGTGKRLLDVGAFPGHLTLCAHSLGFQVESLSGRGESIPSLQEIANRLGRHNISMALVDVEVDPFLSLMNRLMWSWPQKLLSISTLILVAYLERPFES